MPEKHRCLRITGKAICEGALYSEGWPGICKCRVWGHKVACECMHWSLAFRFGYYNSARDLLVSYEKLM
jgi:hypothetical protein